MCECLTVHAVIQLVYGCALSSNRLMEKACCMYNNSAKWRLTADFIIIVGKYLHSARDYVRLMRVCCNYRDVCMFYRYNPISDTTLFKSIQTQHLYTPQDAHCKLGGMSRYIDWTMADSAHTIGKTVHIRDPYKHIMCNMPLLQRWCNKRFDTVMFDSATGGRLFPKCSVMYTDNVYLMMVDCSNNVFGFYLGSNSKYAKVRNMYHISNVDFADKGNIYIRKSASDDFMFSLHSSAGRKAMFKYRGDVIYDAKDADMYECVYIDFFTVRLFNGTHSDSVNLSVITDTPNLMLDSIKDTFLDLLVDADRNCFPRLFALKRVLLIKMSD